jgi:hypothetical protein
MMAWLPLIVVAAGASQAPRERVALGRGAQVRLAETLTRADAIGSMAVSREAPGGAVTVTFSIVRGGEQLRVAATTGPGGEVASLVIEPIGPASTELDGLTWLAVELDDTSTGAIVRLVPADRGGVLLSTGEGRRYLVTPPRARRTGNEAVEARWGAVWSSKGA